MDIEAESHLLGSLLINPEAVVHVAYVLQPEDFSREVHSVIYEAMLSLYRQNEPMTLDGVRAILQQRGQLEAVGGMKYLTTLSQQSENCKRYTDREPLATRKVSHIPKNPLYLKFQASGGNKGVFCGTSR